METKTNQSIDIALRLAVLALMLAWCFEILRPFLFPVLWGIILAIALEPVYNWFLKLTKGKAKLSAVLLTFILVGIILVPSIFLLESALSGLKELKSLYDSGELAITSANLEVRDWPLVGTTLFDFWNQAASNLETFFTKYQDQIIDIGKFIFHSLVDTGASVILLILSIIIAGVLLATPGTEKASEALFGKLAGSFGPEFAKISRDTVHNVVKGVIGVAVIQSLFIGIGFFLADVPYAGLWAILVLILAITQLPPTLVVLPVIIYLFSGGADFGAFFWSIYLVIGALGDSFLKPILMGRGASVPMLVIFLGSLGGFIAFGFIGLFIGAIVLSLAYKLLIYWLGLNKEKVPNS